MYNYYNVIIASPYTTCIFAVKIDYCNKSTVAIAAITGYDIENKLIELPI